VRLVILGGSGSATPELADALVAWPGGPSRRPALEVVLQARSADRLELVAAEMRRRLAAPADGAPVVVEIATDRRAALEGADVVVNAVRVGGLAARAFDETFPRPFGIPGEETMGPGGFANALRTVPALRPTWEDVAAVAPGALVINLTNPSGIVVAAAEREAGLRLVSMCDSPASHVEAIAARLGRPVADVRRRYLGMNHVGWWVPADEAELEAAVDLATGQDPDAVRAQGAVGAAYVRYYVHPDRLLHSQLAASETRAEQLQQLDRVLLAGFAEGATELPRRGAAWYSKAVLPFVDAWLHGSAEPLTVGLRNDGRIPGLPDAVLTEGPVSFPASRTMASLPTVPMPGLPGSLLAAHATFEALTVEAISGGSSRRLLLRALLANPMVATYDQAAGLLDAILAGSPA
jgi:6-phospho-beta-glucosidase